MMTRYTQLRSLTRDAADLILQKKKNAVAGPLPPGMQTAAPPAMAMPPQQQRAPLTAQGFAQREGKPVAMPFVQEPQKVAGPMVKPQGGSVAQQPDVNVTPMIKRYTDPKEQQGAQRWLDSLTKPGAAPYRPPEPAVHDNAKALAKDGYAVTTHSFAKPGDYIVSVQHVNARGERALGHLWVRVGE